MEVLLKAEEEEKESKVHFAERNKCHTINYLLPSLASIDNIGKYFPLVIYIQGGFAQFVLTQFWISISQYNLHLHS